MQRPGSIRFRRVSSPIYNWGSRFQARQIHDYRIVGAASSGVYIGFAYHLRGSYLSPEHKKAATCYGAAFGAILETGVMVPLAAQLVNIHFYLRQLPECRVHLAVAGFPLPPCPLAGVQHIGAQVLCCGYADPALILH